MKEYENIEYYDGREHSNMLHRANYKKHARIYNMMGHNDVREVQQYALLGFFGRDEKELIENQQG